MTTTPTIDTFWIVAAAPVATNVGPLVRSVEPGFPGPCYRTTDRRFRVVRRALIPGWVVLDTSGDELFPHHSLPGCPSRSTYVNTLDGARTAITGALTRARAVVNRRRAWAAKWIVEHDLAGHVAEPTDESLAATFAGCVRVPWPGDYPAIRAAVRERRTQDGMT